MREIVRSLWGRKRRTDSGLLNALPVRRISGGNQGCSPRPRPALRALLIAISGTLHVGSTPTPRAVDAVDAFRQLQDSGVPYRLCSNTSKESMSDVSARLRRLNFEPKKPPREVWTSIGAVGRASQDMGIRSVARVDYPHLNTAFRILAREHPTLSASQHVLIAAHAGRFLESDHPAFFEAVIRNVDANVFFADDEAAHSSSTGRVADLGELGLWCVLVRTGKYRPGDEICISPPPDEVLDAFIASVNSFLSNTAVQVPR
ncbi:hypothetical protein B0H19DRAFT_1290786 [Mycena capillaripes]|nr:hypothetical protein B0H19DRAFT_1290786 [Mycena capillaripes]